MTSRALTLVATRALDNVTSRALTVVATRALDNVTSRALTSVHLAAPLGPAQRGVGGGADDVARQTTLFHACNTHLNATFKA